jgi:predicted dienelactone hydrolase
MEHVGCQHIRVMDEQAHIGFPCFVMYPAQASFGDFNLHPFTIRAGLNAAAARGRFPLVVISHGSGGNRLGYLTIAQALAGAGYVVAMPEHHLNNRDENDLEGTMRNLVLRPKHISLVIDALGKNRILGDAVDTTRVAVIGHSIGAYTGLALAGGKPFSETRCKVAVKPDGRVKALVLMAPATGWYATPDGLSGVSVPVLVYEAEKDPFTGSEHAARVVDQVAGPVDMRRVGNAGHFSFLAPFPEPIARPGFPPSQDPEGFDRSAFHRILCREIVAFLDGALPLG